MNQGLDHKKLSEAAKALERAADAAFRSQQWPHMTNYVCQAQHSAAVAEVACALELVEQSRPKGASA